MTTQDFFDALRQVPNETNKAYAAFLDYINMGAGRSLRKLHEEYLRQTVGKPPTKTIDTLEEWSSTHKWQDRLTQYLVELQTRQQKKQQERLELFNENVWETYMELATLVKEAVTSHEKNRVTKRTRVPDPRNPEQEIEVVTMKANVEGLQRLVDSFGKLGKDLRAQLGLPQAIDMTSKGEEIMSPILITKMDIDEL
jgi:hypothetical protein